MNNRSENASDENVTSNLFKDIASFDAIVENDNVRSKQRRDSAIMDDRAKFSKSTYVQVVNNLNKYYQLVKCQIMSHQCLTTGLYPRETQVPVQKQVAHIRDNIYCSVVVWTLAQAYKRIDNDQGRTKELSLTAIKGMRGILECWMYQAHKVELFKRSQTPQNSLHILFSPITQESTTQDDEYEHLQIDCVALYLIFLVQMSQSGCHIILSQDEVNFVQNLVFYIERAYRTPDYGIWERGNKYNNGSVELHASSIGAAKAALEAINGTNLFGHLGSNLSVIFIDIDAHYRNRVIFDSLLPRESCTENTDAALISTVGWPFFAIHEEQLANRTVDKAFKKLKGSYGLKRFLRDGYGTVVEGKNEKYKASDVKLFEGIECEWPIFLCYLAINSAYKGDMLKAREYLNELQPLMLQEESGLLLPKYYYVPKACIEEERLKTGSQMRLSNINSRHPSDSHLKEDVFLWGQSVYIIANLIVDGLVSTSELDPIGRNLPAAGRPKLNPRYTSFERGSTEQSSPVDLVIQVALIAESTSLQQLLATYGILTQTPHQVEPIQIWSPSELAKAYEQLGMNEELGLTGRPLRPIGGLGSSKVYRACGYTFLCYPLLFELSDFYLAQDIDFVIDEVKSDLAFLGKCWKLAGRPTFCMLLREENMSGPGARNILDLLAQFRRGDCDGTKIRLGRLQEFINTSCIEHLDFLDMESGRVYTTLREKDTGTQFKSFNDIPKSLKMEMQEGWMDESHFQAMSVEDLTLSATQHSVYQQAQALKELAARKGLYERMNDLTFEQCINKLAHSAGNKQIWSVVRYCSSVVGKLVDSLAPSITNILVRGKQLSISVHGHSEHIIDKPITPNEIKEILYTKLYPHDVFQAVLQQELIISIGTSITTKPQLYHGILKIRIGLLVEAMKLELKYSGKGDKSIYALSPSHIKKLLMTILTRKDSKSGEDRNVDILRSRQMEGCLNRVPRGFFERVWHILERTPQGIKLSGYILPQQPTLSDMTQYELNFSLLVDEMLSKISNPAYRQLIVEAFVIVDSILSRNPELSFCKPVEMDKILKDALEMFKRGKQEGIECVTKAELPTEHVNLLQEDLEAFFATPANTRKGTSVYIVRSVMNTLLDTETHEGLDDACVVS